MLCNDFLNEFIKYFSLKKHSKKWNRRIFRNSAVDKFEFKIKCRNSRISANEIKKIYLCLPQKACNRTIYFTFYCTQKENKSAKYHNRIIYII